MPSPYVSWEQDPTDPTTGRATTQDGRIVTLRREEFDRAQQEAMFVEQPANAAGPGAEPPRTDEIDLSSVEDALPDKATDVAMSGGSPGDVLAPPGGGAPGDIIAPPPGYEGQQSAQDPMAHFAAGGVEDENAMMSIPEAPMSSAPEGDQALMTPGLGQPRSEFEQGTQPINPSQGGDAPLMGRGGPNPLAEVIGRTPSGMAPFSQGQSQGQTQGTTEGTSSSLGTDTSTGSSVTEMQRGEPGAARQERYGQAIAGQQGANTQFAQAQYDAAQKGLSAEQEGLAEYQAKLNDAIAQQAAEKATQERFMKAIEDTPIDPDDYQGLFGRVRSTAALMISGFLTGLTNGRNPAFQQVLRMYEHRRDQYVKMEMARQGSALQRRVEAMRSADAAMASMKQQLDGLMRKEIESKAREAGLVDPGAAAAHMNAALDTQAAEYHNKIGGETVRQATETKNESMRKMQQEQEQKRIEQQEQRKAEMRAPKGGGSPIYQMDQEEERIGIRRDGNGVSLYGKAVEELGDKPQAIKELRGIAAKLKALADANGGEIPGNEMFSPDNFRWIRKKLAQAGNVDAQEAISAQSLLSAIELEIKQGGASQLFNSIPEIESLRETFRTGDAKTTLEGIDRIAQGLNEKLVAQAGAYARDPQGLLDLMARQRMEAIGVRPDEERLRRGFIPLNRPEGGPAQEEPQNPTQAGGAMRPSTGASSMGRDDLPTRRLENGTEVPAQRTPLDLDEVRSTIESKGVPSEAAELMMRQVAKETANGKKSYGYNIGGIKAVGEQTYQLLRTHERVDGELKRVREPFASYDSLDAGVDAYLGLLKRRYPRAFQAALSGDASTFVSELKAGGYFTETEENYRKGVAE